MAAARRLAVLSAVVALGLTGCAAGASPEPSTSAPAALVQPAPPLDASELALYGGVARVDLSSNCTATLIETDVDTAPAYLLTNGHCLGIDFGPVNRTLVDAEGEGVARFFDVAGAGGDVLEVDVERYEYATMRGTDVGIVRLDATLGELRAAGAVPLRIAAEAPAEGLAVVNVAAPTENVPDDERVLRKGECTLGAAVDVIEFQWLWLDAVSNDCPGVLGGSSGSPLIADGEIVSLINTTNTGVPVERGDTCYLGKPCEIRAASAVFVADTSYGVDIAGIGECFADGRFALGGACPLPVTTLWDAVGGGIYGPDGVDGGGAEPVLALRSDTSVEVAVITGIPLDGARGCADPASYADAVRVTVNADAEDAVDVGIDLPRENGFVLACAAVAGEEALAARFVFSIDAIAPTEGPLLHVQDLGDALLVDPLFDIPDIADIEMLWGPESETDCADRDAYRPYVRQAQFIDKGELPVRFCAVGFDMAGNESPVTEQVLSK